MRWIALLTCLAAARPGGAASGALIVVDGIYTNVGGHFVLGDTGPSNRLFITNGGWQENSNATVGASVLAADNTVTVTGAGSHWQNTSQLYLGHSSSGNGLWLTNGGRVSAMATYLGYNASSTGNTLVIGGNGSRFDSGSLRLGPSGSGNRVFVGTGGLLVGFLDSVGYGPGSANNSLFVEGAGTRWVSLSEIRVGAFGSGGNHFRASGGGQVICTFGKVGSGTNNTVLLTDPNSEWHCSESIDVGSEGAANVVTVTNGARLICASASLAGTSNRLVVAGAGSALQTSATRGQVVVGASGAGNQLAVLAGGNITTRSGYIFSFNRAAVSGPGALWQNTESLQLGEEFGPAVQLEVAAGGRITAPSAVMAGDNGRIEIRGAGSLLDAAGLFTLGSELGISNQLTIADGGFLLDESGYIGGRDSSFLNGRNNENLALITGPGSVWRNTNELAIGVTGSFNSLSVANGAQVHSRTGFVGFYSYSGNNRVSVTGTNSLWTNRADLFVGYGGSFNRLTVLDGARLAASNAAIGRPGAADNSMLVAGPGSDAAFSGGLVVGQAGARNSLIVSNAGRVTSASGAIDAPIGAANPGRSNFVTITGNNSVWSVAGLCTVGAASSINSLSILAGGELIAGGLQIGGLGTSFGNVAWVNGGRVTVTNSSGSATIRVAGAALRVAGGLVNADRLDATAGPASVVAFESGELRLRNTTISNGLPFVVGATGSAATLLLRRGTHSFADGLLVPSGASLTAGGTIAGAVTNDGSFGIGEGVDGLRITQHLQLGDGADMRFDVGGINAGVQHDYLLVSNSVRFAGALRLTLVNGFVPASNAVLTLADFAASTGSYSNAPSGSRVAFQNSIVSCLVNYAGKRLQLSDFHNAAPAANQIDEEWALHHFGHAPLTPEELVADPDGDGLNNLAEFLAGTDPFDSASVLRMISQERNPQDHVVLLFRCVSDRNYGISFSPDLATWTEIFPIAPNLTAPGVCQWTDDGSQTGGLPFSPASPRRFYRITVR